VFYLLYIPLNLIAVYGVASFQARMAMTPFNLLRASVHVSYTAFLTVLWFSRHVDVRTALVASLASIAITGSLCVAVLVRAGFIDLRARASELRSLMALGFKLNLGNIANQFANRVDLVMLSFLVTPAILGVYVVATAVGTLPLIVPSAVSLVLYPLFARQSANQTGRVFARFMLAAILMTGAAVPVVILLCPFVVRLFFGSAFTGAIVIAQILGVASLMRGMSVMLASVLRGLGAPMRASSGDILGVVVMVIVLIPAIRLAQGQGAALAVLLGTVASAAWMTYQGMRLVRVGPQELIRW
jgi:O-antigen/teichoic acid export membrane protein